MRSKSIITDPVKIQKLIYTIRGEQVMLDSDLAKIYNVETKQINRAVNRNKVRFPKEFIFQLTKKEWESLRYQIGALK
ncbi:MAG: ORF6N domain-containing protein, partial [Candidatus Marinimicrobia bacterium]|nr:ORF6N domain-containing protein [Candidatus Neomarinimicrobiota bacterium]